MVFWSFWFTAKLCHSFICSSSSQEAVFVTCSPPFPVSYALFPCLPCPLSHSPSLGPCYNSASVSVMYLVFPLPQSPIHLVTLAHSPSPVNILTSLPCFTYMLPFPHFSHSLSHPHTCLTPSMPILRESVAWYSLQKSVACLHFNTATLIANQDFPFLVSFPQLNGFYFYC